MSIILAAIDSTMAARPVLETAEGVARLARATVTAVHVADGPFETAAALAERHGVPLEVLHGPPAVALLEALAAPSVIAAVVGARGRPGDERPVGHTALQLIEQAGKPVVVVPPDVTPGAARPIDRVLLPLEGDETTARPVLERLVPLLAEEVELVALHVFTPDTTPRFLDRPGRDLEILSEELQRRCPAAGRIVFRTGVVSRGVADAVAAEGADLVGLSWSQTMDAGHAGIVRQVLAHARVPVLLLPVDGPAVRVGPLPLDPGRASVM